MALFIFRGRWLGRFIGVAIRVGDRPGCARVGVRICYGIFIVSIPGLWMFGLGILARSTCSCSCPMNLFTIKIDAYVHFGIGIMSAVIACSLVV